MPHPPAPVRVLGTSTTLRCEKAEPTVALAVGPARHRGGRVTVIDAWQGRRLGSALAARLSERALEAGIEYPPPKSAPRTGPCSRCCPAWGQVETEQGGPVIAARRKPHGPAQTAATTSADGALHYRATSASSRRSPRKHPRPAPDHQVDPRRRRRRPQQHRHLPGRGHPLLVACPAPRRRRLRAQTRTIPAPAPNSRRSLYSLRQWGDSHHLLFDREPARWTSQSAAVTRCQAGQGPPAGAHKAPETGKQLEKT